MTITNINYKTDLENFLDLYASLGISLETSIRKYNGKDYDSVVLVCGEHPKLGGYRSCGSAAFFDMDTGELVKQCFYEGFYE